MRVKACYRQKGRTDPFDTDSPLQVRATKTQTMEVDEDTTPEEVEQMARKATPVGYEFVKVEEI